MADLDGDGRKEIVVISNEGQLFAFNSIGILADGFPVRMGSESRPVRSGPIIGDIDGDGKPDILSIDSKGDLWVYRFGVHRLAENLVKLTGRTFRTPCLFPVAQPGGLATVGLASVDVEGRIAAVDLTARYNATSMLWPMYQLNPAQTSFTEIGTTNPSPIASGFLPKERVYNWPNPVYGSSTQIRYFTSSDATISVKILDLAGVKIAELQGRAVGGVDGEVTWDVSGIQSGIYLARIEATANGQSDVAIIKIAVVK